jgi:hypothetical protein
MLDIRNKGRLILPQEMVNSNTTFFTELFPQGLIVQQPSTRPSTDPTERALNCPKLVSISCQSRSPIPSRISGDSDAGLYHPLIPPFPPTVT